jgi:thiamine transport system permease protein
MFRHIELPMLRAVLPGAAAVIFLLCLTSFAVALTLGGGPKSSTLELAIFQALRFDFDLGRAALLAALQFALCAAVTVATARVASPFGFGAGLDRAILPFAPRGWRAALDAVAIAAAALLLLAPLLAVLLRGLPGLMDLPSGVWPAALRSVLVALASAGLAVSAALVLALAAVPLGRFGRGIEVVAMLPLAASGLVMGVGLFLVIHPVARPEALALPVTVLVNATLSLPYLFRLLLPQARQVAADYGRLSASLGMGARARLRWVILPRLSRPLGYGAGLAAALSMGDLGVIALFAGDQGATLPLMVQRLMGAYRMEAAAGAALLLVSLSFGIFWLFDRIGDRNADA